MKAGEEPFRGRGRGRGGPMMRGRGKRGWFLFVQCSFAWG